MSHRMKALVSGFDGTESYAAGDVVEVELDHARRAVMRGHGHLVDERNRKIPLAAAIAILRLPDDDIVRIETSDKAVMNMKAEIEAKRQEG